MSRCRKAGQEKICAASHRREGRQPEDLFPDRALRDFVFQRAVLMADDRVAFVAEFVKIPVVHPDILRKLELSNEARANHERDNAAFPAVLRRAFGQRGTIGRATPNHAAAVHVRRGVAGIHPPDVRAERYGITE